MAAAYMIDVRPRARRSLRQLDPPVRKAVAHVIDGLAADPRPPGLLLALSAATVTSERRRR